MTVTCVTNDCDTIIKHVYNLLSIYVDQYMPVSSLSDILQVLSIHNE